MKKTITVTVLLTLAICSTQAQEVVKQATARIFESADKDFARIVLVYEDGKSEIIPLRDWRAMGGNADKIIIENQVVINKLLNDMSQKRYELTKYTPLWYLTKKNNGCQQLSSNVKLCKAEGSLERVLNTASGVEG